MELRRTNELVTFHFPPYPINLTRFSFSHVGRELYVFWNIYIYQSAASNDDEKEERKKEKIIQSS